MGAAHLAHTEFDDITAIAARLEIRFPRLDSATVRRFVSAVARHPSVNMLPGPVRRRQIERLAAVQLGRVTRELRVVHDGEAEIIDLRTKFSARD